MLSKRPHISIEAPSLVPRILRIAEQDFADWPDAVKGATIAIAEELFLALYNPYIPAETVKKSVRDHFEMFRKGLALHYATSINEGITLFWSAWEEDARFRDEVIAKLSNILPQECIDVSRHARVANATDATDLRLELPLLVITPRTAEQVQNVVKLANTMQFALIPRGGGSGLTGGAIPARKRCVVMSMTKMTGIGPLDATAKTIAVQAGVLTINVAKYAKAHGLFFSVDPASKEASTIGGNVAENAGGPLCFEYGTTIDNLLSYRMVTPTGELVAVTRKDHPRSKITENDKAIFEVRDISGGLRTVVRLPGTVLRKEGLGKDVTNKALAGLPGVQKEGTDGVIVDATFILHDILAHHRVLVLEFFGRSMENCMLVVNDIVQLRDGMRHGARQSGDLVKISALEEFGAKYVQAIEYQKKSSIHEGDPISVLILQLDSDHAPALEDAVASIAAICQSYSGVDVFIAKDEAEAEVFWEDRHRLSAIAKRTSGFKINEDVVLPLRAIPEYALFLERLNLECMGRAYRRALQQLDSLPNLPEDDTRVETELAYAMQIIKGEISIETLSDQELELHAVLMLRAAAKDYPEFTETIEKIEGLMKANRVIVASHMHAGDGNWHVNIPVNSNHPRMLHLAETIASRVMAKAQELGGEVTGEHGVGITKIAFLTDEKLAEFKEYKNLVDPCNIMNPAKLTQRHTPVAAFTFSFNHLIEDIRQSGLADKERLISLLAKVQICTRCGKCKLHCPMYFPEQSMEYQPRNKNMVLGALIEAIYYTQVNSGKPDPGLLAELRSLVEFCTACGKCFSVCPVKITSPDVNLSLRSYLEDEGAGGHAFKGKILRSVAKDPASRIPRMAKAASLGQGVQNRALAIVPKNIRNRFANPIFSGPGPKPGYLNLMEGLHLSRGSLFVPDLPNGKKPKGTILFFPGCGGAVFFRTIGLAGAALLLHAGYAVLLPKEHLCCGYPLLAAGDQDTFAVNQDHNIRQLRSLSLEAAEAGYPVSRVVTACGTCLDGMRRHFITAVVGRNGSGKDANKNTASATEGNTGPKTTDIALGDICHFLFTALPSLAVSGKKKAVYHAPCHAQIAGVKATVAGQKFANALAGATGMDVALSPGCCGESGLGAISSPAIYNKIRGRKTSQLASDLELSGPEAEVLVSCPSCRMGLVRIFMGMGRKQRVLHVLEYMAESVFGSGWRKNCRKAIGQTRLATGSETSGGPDQETRPDLTAIPDQEAGLAQQNENTHALGVRLVPTRKFFGSRDALEEHQDVDPGNSEE